MQNFSSIVAWNCVCQNCYSSFFYYKTNLLMSYDGNMVCFELHVLCFAMPLKILTSLKNGKIDSRSCSQIMCVVTFLGL